MSAKISFGREPFPSRVLACLLSAALAVSLCPLQGWSDEPAPGSAPDELMKAVPLSDEPEASQLTKAVPLGEESEVPQLMKAVPLAAEPDSPEPASSEAPAQDGAAKTVKVTFVVSDEPAASWPDPENVDAPEGADPSTADRTVEVPAGESLGALVPPTPVSSDDSLVFEGWQTEDFVTIPLDELSKRVFDNDEVLYALFSSKGNPHAKPYQWDANWVSVGGSIEQDMGISPAYILLRAKSGTDGRLMDRSPTKPYWPWEEAKLSCERIEFRSIIIASADLSDFFANMQGWYLANRSFSPGTLGNFDTSTAVKMKRFCAEHVSSSVSFSGLNTAMVEDMSEMFTDCPNLTSVNLTGWTFDKVTDMSRMFYNCPKLRTVPANLVFKEGTNTAQCFYVDSATPVLTTYAGEDPGVKSYDWPSDNRALVGLPLTGKAEVSGSVKAGNALEAKVTLDNPCRNAQLLYQWFSSPNSDGSNATALTEKSAQGAKYTITESDKGAYLFCEVSDGLGAYTNTISTNVVSQPVLSATVKISGKAFSNQELSAEIDLSQSTGATAGYQWYKASSKDGERAAISGANNSSYAPQANDVGSYLFCKVTDQSGTYQGEVVSEPVGPIGIAWGTSGPKAGGCVWTIDAAGAMVIAPAANGQGSLGELSWNSVPWSSYVAQVTSARVASGVKAGASLSCMFGSCSKMTTVDLSGLETSDATDLSSMFSACSSLATVKGLDVLNSAKPSNLGSMFYGCSKLTTLDLSGLAAGTATDLSAMFRDCSQLSDLKLPAGFVGEKCTTVVNMFYGCNALATIPSTFGFGSNKSIQTAGCFTVTGTDPLATTYLGDDLNVANYNWQGSNRSLVVWKLSGEATIAGGDDPIADNKLTASATFTGPAAGLEEGATYQWCTANSADDANLVAIDKATGATYSPRKADVGKFLVCLVSAPKDSGAQGTLRAVTTKAVRAPQVWATVPSRTQVYVDSQGRASVPTTSAYALGALDSEGKATEGDIQLVGVTLTLGDPSFPGGSWTLGTPGDGEAKASTFIENKAFATTGTDCTVEGAPAIAPGSKLPLEWEASFKNDIGPKLTSLLTAADGEGAHYGVVEFKVAWKPRA